VGGGQKTFRSCLVWLQENYTEWK